MLRTFNDTLYSTPIINAVNLSAEFGLKQSKTGIRQLFFSNFYEKEGQPIVQEYQSLLSKIGIDTVIAKLPVNQLAEAPVPFLIILEDDDKDFSMVTGIDKNTGLVSVNKSNIILKRSLANDFPKDYYVVILPSAVNHAIAESDFEVKRRTELSREENYRNSIRVVENAFDKEECARIIGYCEKLGRFQKSKVYNNADTDGDNLKNKNIYSKDRTSSNMSLDGYGNLDFLHQRICEILQCSKDQIEPLSCIRYEESQQFKYHHDFIQGGDRIYTAVVYLNDDFTGGELRFPEIDFVFQSSTGTCIVFQNIDENGTLIPESMHGSLPITSGVKYAIPVFMHVDRIS